MKMNEGEFNYSNSKIGGDFCPLQVSAAAAADGG
jgi:hypothetical protein